MNYISFNIYKVDCCLSMRITTGKSSKEISVIIAYASIRFRNIFILCAINRNTIIRSV